MQQRDTDDENTDAQTPAIETTTVEFTYPDGTEAVRGDFPQTTFNIQCSQ
jgi:hypothetical protein